MRYCILIGILDEINTRISMPNIGVRQKLFCIFVIFRKNSRTKKIKFHQIYL